MGCCFSRNDTETRVFTPIRTIQYNSDLNISSYEQMVMEASLRAYNIDQNIEND